MNLSSIIDQAARYHGPRPAVVYQGRTITYARLLTAVNRVAGYLLDRGLNPGDRVAILSPNRPVWIALYYGIIRVGGVAVCLSAAYKGNEIMPLLKDSGARFLLAGLDLSQRLPESDEAPLIETIIIETDPILSTVFREPTPGDPKTSPLECRADDPCAILYTGGTTGRPKGAMLTHLNILYTAQNVCYHERTRPGDRALCFMPLNHVFGGIHIMNATFYGCGALVLHESFDLEELLDSIQTNAVTRFYAVPTVYIRLLNNPGARARFKSVTYCFSAATSMASEIVRQWKDRFDLTIHESYGMTETASLVTFNHLYRHRIGSVGTLAGAVEIRLVDPEGHPVPMGRTGEITIRGPNVMKGYFNRPSETREAIKDGWLHSGDIGRFDQDGYLYIVDRIKDLVISGGLNVYPSEVEEVLFTHPAVEECAVVGTPHPDYGEAVTAFVVSKGGREVGPAELVAHCKKEMASYKAPKKVFFVRELPKSPTGKILRRKIREGC